MHLFELAMELGVRSAEMAEAAPSLGFEDVTPTSVLTPEQVQAFRTRFAPAPTPVLGASNAYPGSQPIAPPDWEAPPPPPVAPSGGSSGGGSRMVQMGVIAVAVIGVIGLFAFMFANSGTDEKRMDRIAAAEPIDEGPTVTGPDGKPLSKKEREYLAALGANKVRQEQRACEVVKKISDLDKAYDRSLAGMNTFEEFAQVTPTLAGEQAKINVYYDELARLAPEQAENIRILKQVADDLIRRFQAAAASPAAFQEVVGQMKTEVVPPATWQALEDIEAYGMATCGVSMANN